MQEPTTAPWGLSISKADLKKLKVGFEPQDQDDKWRISVKDQNWSGNNSIHIIRSGMGKRFYVLVVKLSDGGRRSSSVSSGVKIEAITWEQNKGGIHISKDQAKKEVVIITRGLLECEFDAHSEYDASICRIILLLR